MKQSLVIIFFFLGLYPNLFAQNNETFPDGTPISNWFQHQEKIQLNSLGKTYTITDYGVVKDSTIIQTAAIQKVIDLAADNGSSIT